MSQSTESVKRFAYPSRTQQTTDKRTHIASWSPWGDISPFVTRTRTYGFLITSTIEAEASA